MTTELQPGQQAFLVKYAITRKGEPEVVVVKSTSPGGYVHVDKWFNAYKLGRDIAPTREEADALIMAMVEKKIAQVNKQLKSLEQIRKRVDARAGLTAVSARAGKG